MSKVNTDNFTEPNILIYNELTIKAMQISSSQTSQAYKLILIFLFSILPTINAECRLRNHLDVLGDENILSIDQYHFAIDEQQKTFVTAGQVKISWDYFYQKGYTEGIRQDSDLFQYFNLFGTSPDAYKTYVENEMKPDENVSIAFTLAYDFNACKKVWDAFYINLPGGILGVDADSEGNFVVAAYDGVGMEYILRHRADGGLPQIWKFDVSQDGMIVPGGIYFAYNNEWICTYSPTLFKAFRHNQVSTHPDMSNAYQLLINT